MDITRDRLETEISKARVSMLRAWKEQSLTTAEEGATYEQARAAIKAAKAAQARYYELCSALEKHLAGKIVLCSNQDPAWIEPEEVEDSTAYEWSRSPLGGW